MTACIVGWAHTPFGKLGNETVESLIIKVANEAVAHAGIGPEDVDEILLGHFNAGFTRARLHRLDRAPGERCLPVQAGDPRRERLFDRHGGGARSHQDRGSQARQDHPCGRRRADDPRAEPARSRAIFLKASYLAEDGETPGGFAGVFGKIAASYFQRHGDQSDALALIAAKNHKNGVCKPLCADPQGLRLRVLPPGVGEEPVRGRSSEAHRLLARLRRGSGPRHRRSRDGPDHAARGRLPRHHARERFLAAVEARHPEVRGLHCRSGVRRWTGRHHARRPLVCRDARLLHHRRAASNTRRWGSLPRARARAPSRRAGRRRTAGCPSTRPAGSRARATRSGRPACPCTCMAAMQLMRRGRRHADPGCHARPASSTWAAQPSPTTSRSWSGRNDPDRP